MITNYLKELLNDNECVIIPEFGAFISKRHSATIDYASHRFLPPYKEIVFNNKLTNNDEILVDFISKKESVSKEDSLTKIQNFVNQAVAILDVNNEFVMEGLGKIRKFGNDFVFEVSHNENLLGDSFGLTEFNYKPVFRTETYQIIKEKIVVEQKEKNTNYTIAIESVEEITTVPRKRPSLFKSLAYTTLAFCLIFLINWTTEKSDSNLASWNPFLYSSPNEFLIGIQENRISSIDNGQQTTDNSLCSQDGRDVTPVASECNQQSAISHLYELNKLIDESDMTNLMNFTVLNAPLLEFYPSQLDSAAIAKNEREKQQSFEIYQKLLKDRQEINANTEIIDAAILAAYRAYIVTLKNELRVNLYKTMLNPTEENVAFTKNMSEQFLDSLHCLKKRFVKSWDMESRSYYRNVFTERYDKIAKDVLNAGNVVFIETTRPQDHKTTSGQQTLVSLKTIFNDRDIYYTIDGSTPDKNSKVYNGPFAIERSCIVKAVCFEDNRETIVNEKYILYHKGMGHFKKLNTVAGNYRPEYSGGSEDALLNGAVGTNNYKDGNWQGFYGTDCDLELDFGKKEKLNSLKINFNTNPYDWILLPKKMSVYVSNNGTNYTLFKTFEISEDVDTSKTNIVTKTFDISGLNSRFVRIVVETPGLIPEGLPGYNNPSWMFMDEIVVE